MCLREFLEINSYNIGIQSFLHTKPSRMFSIILINRCCVNRAITIANSSVNTSITFQNCNFVIEVSEGIPLWTPYRDPFC